MVPRPDGRFDVATSRGTRFDAGAVIIAGGVGSFQPRRLAVEGSDKHEGHSIHYRVKDATSFHDKDLVIFGGGDSALDWTLALIEHARSIVLVHRRAEFRGAPASVERMLSLVEEGRLDFIEGQVQSVVEQEGKLTGVRVTARDGVTRTVATDQVLVFWGLSPKLGPIAEWGLTLHRRTIAVDTHRFQTNIGHLCRRRHQRLSGQEEVNPLRLPRSGPRRLRGQRAPAPRREDSPAIHDDQPAIAEAAGRDRRGCRSQ